MSDIKVRIYGEFQDQGFKRAGKATRNLEKSLKKLGGTIASVFAAQQIVKFGKESVKAFIEDDKAVRRLITTYRNLGMAFEGTLVSDYIDQLQKATGVAEDQLRPAIEVLTRSTLDYNKAQELLNTALDISAGTGYDLQTVSNALSKAYLGNLTSLARLNVGIGQAEAKSISFDEALGRLNSRFKGQAAQAASSYEGRIAKLKITINEAKEAIGKDLVTSFDILSGSQGLSSFEDSINRISKKIGDMAVGFASLISLAADNAPSVNKKKSLRIPYLDDFLDSINPFIQAELQGQLVKTLMTSAPSRGGAPGAQRIAAENAKLLAKQIAQQKKLIAAQKAAAFAAAKKEKETQQLKRAGTVFDIENIQIVAALQGRINEEQRLRLVALLAINNDIADAADKTTSAILALQAPMLNTLGIQIKASDNASTVVAKIVDAQTKIFLLNAGISNIPKAKNPFEDWDAVMKNIIKNLDTIADKITKMPSASTTATATSTTSISTPSGTTTTSSIAAPTGLGAVARGEYPRTAEVLASVIASNYAPDLVTAALGMGAVSRGEYTANIPTPYSAGMGAFGRGEYGSPTVIVNVTGSVTAEADLAETIRDYLFDYQKTGGDIRTSAVAI